MTLILDIVLYARYLGLQKPNIVPIIILEIMYHYNNVLIFVLQILNARFEYIGYSLVIQHIADQQLHYLTSLFAELGSSSMIKAAAVFTCIDAI